MLDWLIAWRSELLTIIVIALTAWAFRRFFGKSFLNYWWPGALLGLAVEFMTEPEWTYSMKIFIWRDVSPFVIVGWGVTMGWVVLLSDMVYQRWFGRKNKQPWKIILVDLTVGWPLLISNELFGMHIMKSWKYNDILNWNTMIPVIDFPLQGILVIGLFVLAMPAIIRFWKDKGNFEN